MTTTTITRLKYDIEAARSRGDLVAVARLRSEIPLDQRNKWDAMNGHLSITAAGRGYSLALARVVGGLAPAARTSLTRAPAQSVAITSSVRNSLDDIFDGAETGGYLYGPTDQSDGEIQITHAFVASGDRTGTSVVLDLDRGIRIWNELPSDLTVRGDFHCHPNDGHVNPSSNDLQSWECSAQFFERDWIGLVVRSAPARVFGRETSRFEINATIARYENGRASHRQIEISTRSY